MPRQKSAEAVVATRDRGEGPNDDTESRTTELVTDPDDRSTVRSGGLAAGAEPEARILSRGVEVDAATGGRTKSEDHATMERVVERANMRLAYQRVLRNKGAAGVDDLTVAELKDWLAAHWPSVKKALLEGRYLPRPVRRVDIPKPSGGVRTLGIPTVVDRLIQQALLQVLSPVFEPTFSDRSYGFRPGRSAAQAVVYSMSRWLRRSSSRHCPGAAVQQLSTRPDYDRRLPRGALCSSDQWPAACPGEFESSPIPASTCTVDTGFRAGRSFYPRPGSAPRYGAFRSRKCCKSASESRSKLLA